VRAFNIVSAPKKGISAVEALIAEAKDKIMLDISSCLASNLRRGW
jgi:hypothetical protein